MNPTIIIGTVIVTCALIFYSLSVITEQRTHSITKFILTFLTLGISFDITATIFMITGSKNSPFTFHGILGYSALVLMLIDTILIWKTELNKKTVSKKLHLYTGIAYLWWVISYFVSGFMAALHLY
jgi:hypothetical protein